MVDSAPTLVLVNGHVLTMDADSSVAEAVALRDQRIIAVGDTADILPLAGQTTRVVDLAGRTVLPGINDSHLHGAAYALTKPPFALDVGHPAVGSIEDIVAVVRTAVASARPGEWIVGLGWDPGYLAECRADPRRLPNRHDLDRVSPDNPVCLNHFSAHSVLANSAALRVSGVDRTTRPPSEPGLGAGGAETLFGGLGADNLTAYAGLVADSQLDARVSVLLLPAPMGGSVAELRSGLDQFGRFESVDPQRLRVLGVKIFGDGVPPNRTAWMSEPYSDGGHGSLCVHGGTPELRVEELREMIRVVHQRGYQAGVHVTGDRAIDTVADALVAANEEFPRPDARHYVIHGDFVSPESLAKLAAHDYGINMNPSIKWTISDLMDEVVGPNRSAHQWPVRSAFEAGVTVCASSDAPVTEPDWRQGVAGMMLRESKASGRSSGPDQCVGLVEALRAYTTNPARQDFAESWKGSIEVGKNADLCVLDRDLVTADPHDIPGISVDLTVFDGQVVYERSRIGHNTTQATALQLR